MKFPFTDRDTYLKWRAEWKAEYKALSESIRDEKRRAPMFIRKYQRTTSHGFTVRTLISKEPNPLYGTSGVWLGGSASATWMLEQLKEAKALSWSMKQSAKAEAAKQDPAKAA